MTTNRLIRTETPGLEPNNQDVFIWALYLLGGADKDVDVEDIYLKCFELAPARLGWRTRPDLPDYKKAAKALQSVEASTHIGLVHRPHKYSRSLTVEGIHWVQTFEEILSRNYSQGAVHASKSSNQYERIRFEISKSVAWAKFKSDPNLIDISDAAAALQCSPASPLATWQNRIINIKKAADVLVDPELLGFAEYVNSHFVNGSKS